MGSAMCRRMFVALSTNKQKSFDLLFVFKIYKMGKLLCLIFILGVGSLTALWAQSQNASTSSTLKSLYDIRTNRDNTVSGVDLDRILLERRKELAGEGHRFFDLMRLSRPVIRVCSDHFAIVLELQPDHYRAIAPIPVIEMNANPNMLQNPGY